MSPLRLSRRVGATTGRRTGLPRTVPLLYVRDGERFVVCNVDPGFERPNPWVLNLQADPRARIQVGRQLIDVTAHAADGAELERCWPRLVRLWPAYRTFEERGGRRAVFVLEPAESSD
ncbi:nitroreductase/quinone reductase family protein [Geodermatophilus sp. SYSU D00697]